MTSNAWKAYNFEGKRIYKDMKVNGKHEKLKHKLDQADSVAAILNSFTADFSINKTQ